MTPGGCTAFGRLPFSDRQSPQRTWWKGEQPVFEHVIAAVAKFFFAAGLVAGASGAGNVDLPEWHLPKAPVHTEKTHEPQASPEATKTPERYSFESLLKECVTRYTGHLDGAKDVCTAAIAASGLEADAFWAKYRSLLVKELPKTEPTTSFEALLKECVARYARAASNTKEARDAKTGPHAQRGVHGQVRGGQGRQERTRRRVRGAGPLVQRVLPHHDR